ncbi:MAG: response regulator transcription factor [Pseudomonadota bacterium]
MSTRKTILLVEDEFDTRELLGRALERAGYAALTAANAAEALNAANAASTIDLVVTDVVLGTDSLGGLELMTALRKEGVRAPVVIITAYADVEKLKIALNEGAAHFLEKPFRAPKLLEVIERVLKNAVPFNHAVEEILTRAQLTDKELTVARLLLDGLSSSEIAARENNSPKTIRQHVTQIYAKCGVASRAQFFRLAYLR